MKIFFEEHQKQNNNNSNIAFCMENTNDFEFVIEENGEGIQFHMQEEKDEFNNNRLSKIHNF